jgi:nucleoside-diphosphate-sugar epimerase
MGEEIFTLDSTTRLFAGKAVLVTGATGFIGRHLVRVLLAQGAAIVVLSRRDVSSEKYKTIIGDLTRPATLEDICRGVDIVFHLGGYAHAVDEPDGKFAETNWRVTVDGTTALIAQSLQAGVDRFLFFSSVKAMGEGSEACLDESIAIQPVTSYGKAKREAEKIVMDASQQGLSPTVLRLPMVYGPSCKGNLPRMIQAVARGRFPPLPETNNRRSMVDVRDVVQAALLAAANPAAVGQRYIVTDGQVYSTRQMYEWICTALNRPLPTWTIPLFAMRFGARLGDVIGRVGGKRFPLDTDALDKLTGSACYSSEKISRELHYRPAYTLDRVLPEIVAEVMQRR